MIICCSHCAWEEVTSWEFFGQWRATNDIIRLMLCRWIFREGILIAKLFKTKLILTFPFRATVLIPSMSKREKNLANFLWKIHVFHTCHVFTCVSDKFNWLATSPRSATDKYFWHRNFLSRKASCEWVKAVRLRRLRFIGIFDELNKDLKFCESDCDGLWMLE